MSNITLDGVVYAGIGYNDLRQSAWVDKSGGVPSSFSYLTMKANLGTGSAKSTAKVNLSIPVIAEEATACACPGDILDVDRVHIEVTFGKGAGAARREHVRKAIQSLATDAVFIDLVDNLTQGT